MQVTDKELFVAEKNLGKVKNGVLIFKIHAISSGETEVSLENTEILYKTHCLPVFNRVSIGEFSLSLLKGSEFILHFLEVYDSKITNNFNRKIEKVKKLAGGERLMKIKIKPENLDKHCIKLLGLTDDQAEEVLSKDLSFPEAIDYSLNNFTLSVKPEVYENSSTCIIDVKVYETKDQIPSDYTEVRCLERNVKINFDIPNRKYLAFRNAPC